MLEGEASIFEVFNRPNSLFDKGDSEFGAVGLISTYFQVLQDYCTEWENGK